MVHNAKEVLDYWNDPNNESMYDKHLIKIEIDLIKSKLKPQSKILDAGCGEGEGTFEYSKIPGVIVHGTDFSDTRLKKAEETLKGLKNIRLTKIDFLSNYQLDHDYDFIVSQRFLINLMEWGLQKKVILGLANHLKKGGKLIMFEGSKDGVNQLNEFRKIFCLPPIAIKWHNLFFIDKKLESFLKDSGLRLVEKDGLGEYFMLTRGIRPIFDNSLDWNTQFNMMASNKKVKTMLNFRDRLSRLKLWIVEK